VTALLATRPGSDRFRRFLDTEGAPTAATASSDWSGHVIVCGLEGVGLRTVEQLRSTGVAVVVVDDDPAAKHSLTVEGWGCHYIAAGGSVEGQLRQAGLAGARAVVCTSRSDLRNVETALLARDLRDDVDVVAHLDNPTVGRAVEEATGAGSALDVAGLFAPAVIDACMYRSSHDVVLGGERFVAAEFGVGGQGTLRELFGDLVPVGVVRPDGELVVCPGRDLGVAPGDRVTVLGKPEELSDAELSHAAEPEPVPDQGSSLRQFLRRASRSLAQGTDRAVGITLVLSLAMLVAATIVLRLAYRQGDGTHLSLIQAFYFTIETFATVGFGDFSFAHQSTGLQVFGILLIIAGVTLSTVILALITNALVSRRIEQSLGQGSIKGMEGHVVLVGLGAVGLRVLEGLRSQGRDVVVVERDESNRYVQHARGLGAPVVHGDATLGQTLRSVNLAQAGAVAILTSDDLVNLETGLAVRDVLAERWIEVPVVLRVFDRALGSRLQQTFNFNHVWSTAALASPWFVGAVLGLEILATFYVRNQPFLVARLEVREGGGLAGLAMQELGARIRVVAIARRGDEGSVRNGEVEALEYPPRRDTRLAAGDRAYLLGPYEELLRVLSLERTAATP
jgi:Trk K+ transport system NAD-binding subunit